MADWMPFGLLPPPTGFYGGILWWRKWQQKKPKILNPQIKSLTIPEYKEGILEGSLPFWNNSLSGCVPKIWNGAGLCQSSFFFFSDSFSACVFVGDEYDDWSAVHCRQRKTTEDSSAHGKSSWTDGFTQKIAWDSSHSVFFSTVPCRQRGIVRSPSCSERLTRFPTEPSWPSIRNASLSSTAKVCVDILKLAWSVF